jgi:endonuclease/exonuclease/phosphatase family metal-dependent hydrolase
MSATDDLIALGCGAAVGKVFFWGLILSVTLVFMHPWILLIALAIWWLVKTYGAENVAPDGGAAMATVTVAQTAPKTMGPAIPAGHSSRPSPNAQGRETTGDERMICMTWNLGRRNHPGQLDLIRDAGADIVALHEVSTARRATLANDLATMGLAHQHGSAATSGAFPFTSMIASRWPVRAADAEGLDVPFPERVKVVIVTTPFGEVEVLNVHVPAATSSGVAVKVATFEGIARYLTRAASIPRIVCGDFNTPQSESFGNVQYWGTHHQQSAERAVIEGEAVTGLQDAFRSVNGPSATAASWRASNGTARRYDHIFASQDLAPIEAAYGDLEQITVAKMSDHAPLRVVFHPALAATDAAPVHDAPPPADVPESRTPPIPLTSVFTKEEKAMTTPESADLNAFLKGLTFRTDVRKDSDNLRRGQFRAGWNKAMDGGTISDKKLMAELSWHNLGFRAGKTFGQATATTIDDVYDRFAALYVRERG